MPQLASLSRLGLLSTFAVVLAAACGGQSFTGGDDGEAGSSSTAGKTSQGGSTSRAGATSRAGSGTGNTGSTTTTGGAGIYPGGTTSVAGAGGAVPWNEACDAEPLSGNCDAYIESWYHEPGSGLCRPFVYGGCGGNLNRYASLAACQKACPGGNPNYDACKQPSDCIVTGTGCCGVCDSPSVTAHDLVSYNHAYASLLQCGLAFGVAGDAAGAAAPVACAPCMEVPDGTLKNFVPSCVANQCAIEDIRLSATTACKTNAECKLRSGSSCCESCSAGDLIAVRSDGSFEKLVCGSGPVGCPACLPAPTPGAVAICGSTGHCEVAYVVNDVNE
jgi:Kunitz/Bovine pancreatic trypsin inhibitor domain